MANDGAQASGELLPEDQPADERIKINDDGSVTVKLFKPIRNFETAIDEITFRKPTALESEVIESHVWNDIDGNPRLENRKIMANIRRLNTQKLPQVALNMMDYNDIVRCGWATARFFLPLWGGA